MNVSHETISSAQPRDLRRFWPMAGGRPADRVRNHLMRAEIPSIATIPEGVHRPFWSVMIPTYNCANYLPDTLKSVLIEDPGPAVMQIEVVDDCSTQDDPEKIVYEIGKARASFFRQPVNIGATANLTSCIKRATGYCVQILHGDDLVIPGFYCRLQEAFTRKPGIGAVFCRHITLDEEGHWQ